MPTPQLSEMGRRSRACSRNARLAWDNKVVPLNVALLREVETAILETPLQFTMWAWRRGDVFPGAHDKVSGRACIASWSVVLCDRIKLSTLTTTRIALRARRILGLRPRQAQPLFYLEAWPEKFRHEYILKPRDYSDCVQNSRVAAARIEAFIEGRLKEESGKHSL